MKALFTPETLEEPNWLQRLFHILPKQNARIELNNLLASKPLMEITPEDVAEIAGRYKVDLYKECKEHLNCMYAIALTEALKDHEITDEELWELSHLKSLLYLKDADIEDLHHTIAGDLYKKHLEKALSDRRYSPEEQQTLEALRNSLKLSEPLAAKISEDARKIMVDNFLRSSVSDQRFSEEEEKEFQALCRSLGVSVDFDKETYDLLDKFKLYWLIENGELPEKQSDIHLQKNEKCYFIAQAEWLETRTVTKSVRYGGPSVSIRIMRGVYYRTGGYNVQRITAEETKVIDTGTLYLTNKRFVFMGEKKNSTIRLDKILSVTPYSNGIEIAKDSGRNPMFRINGEVDLLAMIAGRVINDY